MITLVSCKPATDQTPAIPDTTETVVTTAPAKPECQMVLGMDAWEPYQYMTVDNRVAGLDIELAKTILTDMGCSISVVQGSWTELLNKLKSGEIDLVLGASKTEDREQFAYFSDPYRKEQFQLYVRKEQASLPFTDIKSFIEAGHKVGVVNEYYYGDQVASLYEDDKYRQQFIGAIISELNMARLLDEEIDGLLEDSFVAASILRRKGLDKYIQPHSISLESSEVFLMFSKQSVAEQTVADFNRGLQQLRSSGEYNRIVEKYSL